MFGDSDAVSQDVQSGSAFVAVRVTLRLSALTFTVTDPPDSILPPFASAIFAIRPASAAGTLKGTPTISSY